MSVQDNGGFDLALEVPVNTLLSAVASSFPATGGTAPITAPGFTGTAAVATALVDVGVAAPSSVTLAVDLAGSSLTIQTINLGGVTFTVPGWMQTVPLGGTVEVTDVLQVAGLNVVVDFTVSAGAGTPLISLSLDQDALLASPLATFILAQAILANPGDPTAYDVARAALLAAVEQAVLTRVQAAVAALGVQTVAAPPAGLGVTSTAFRVGNRAIHLLFAIGGAPGVPGLITRSNLLRRTSDGEPLDALAVMVSNASLLRDFIRPGLGITLPAAGFLPGHPFFWTGATPLPVPGGLPAGVQSATLNSLMFGIDGTNVRALARVLVTGVGGSFTLQADVDLAFGLTATITGTTLTVTAAPARAPIVSSEIDIAAWVYVAGFFTGGAVLTGVLVAIDLVGGSLLNGPIAAATAGLLPTITVPVPVPPGLPALTPRTLSLAQADSITRTVTLPFGIVISDAFPAHDVIATFS